MVHTASAPRDGLKPGVLFWIVMVTVIILAAFALSILYLPR